MTYKEAISVLRADYYHVDTQDAVDFAIEVLEKADKYRWHDLRRNPDDLPPKETEVLTYDGDLYNLAIYDHEYKHWYDSYEDMELRFVKAWRKIETFKEEE